MEKNQLTVEEYAARLRGARGLAGWTLDQMGELLNISPQKLSKLENCKQDTTEAERFYFAALICRDTELPMEWFTEPDRARLTDALRSAKDARDDLTPREVVELVEDDDPNDGEETSERS